jgi:hypothetical protein
MPTRRDNAIDRVEDFCRKYKAEKPTLRGMKRVDVPEMVVEDLMVLIAVANGAQGDGLKYLEWAEAAINGWREANERQREIITRLTNFRHRVSSFVQMWGSMKVAPDRETRARLRLIDALTMYSDNEFVWRCTDCETFKPTNDLVFIMRHVATKGHWGEIKSI